MPASKPRRLPTVLNIAEVQRVLAAVNKKRDQAIFSLLYGSRLRINEYLRLRIKDIDFALNCITIHDSKGNKGRTTLLPWNARLS